MRLIDGHALMERLQEQTAVIISPVLALGLLVAQRDVLAAPTIDAVEVFRWWLVNQMDGYCCGYNEVEYNGKWYYTVHHA